MYIIESVPTHHHHQSHMYRVVVVGGGVMWENFDFRQKRSWAGFAHNMPVSASALWRIVSFTAANTSRMFDVSVAWVRLRTSLAFFCASPGIVEVEQRQRTEGLTVDKDSNAHD